MLTPPEGLLGKEEIMKINVWEFGVNPHPNWRKGTLYLYEQPLWLGLVGLFVDVIGYGCCLFHWLKFPDWITVARDGEKLTMKEWYGDAGQLWHLFIYCPIFEWYDRRKQDYVMVVEIGYDRLKEILGPAHADFFAYQDDFATED